MRQNATEIASQRDRILADARFRGSPSLSRFLQFTIQAAIEGEADGLKETVLGLAVFDRGEDFDPRIDPIVRVQAGKLRAKLRDYYANEGCGDPLLIEYPKGSYCPRFVTRSGSPALSRFRRSVRELLAPAARAIRRHPALAWLLLAVVAAVTLSAWRPELARPRRGMTLTSLSAIELTRLTPHSGSSTFPTLSHDGSVVVYSSDQGNDNLNLWVEYVGQGSPVQITRHQADDITPDLSPDGKWVVFRSRRDGGGLFVVSITGQHERRIAGRGWWPRFSPDGAWISFSGPSRKPWSGLFLVAAAGGEAREVPTGDVSPVSAPLWTPQGERLVFLGTTPSGPGDSWQFDWYVVPRDGGQPVPMGLNAALSRQGLPEAGADTLPRDWLGSSIVFTIRTGSSTNVWRVPVDLAAGRVAGEATRLTLGAANETMPRCSRNGRMVFVSEHLQTHVYSLPIDPDGHASGEPQRVTDDDTQEPGNTFVQLSSNGERLLFSSISMGARNLVVKDLPSGEEQTLLDARQVPAEFRAGSASSELERGCEPVGEPLRLAGVEAGLLDASTATASARWRLCESSDRSRLVVLDLAAGTRATWLTYPERSLSWALLSPDQRWAALVFPDWGAFIAPFDGNGAPPQDRWIPVGNADPAISSLYWSHDGKLLYFFSVRDDNNCLWAQRLDPRTKMSAGAPFAVRHFHDHRLFPWSSGMSVAPQRIVFSLTEPRASVWLAQVDLP